MKMNRGGEMKMSFPEDLKEKLTDEFLKTLIDLSKEAFNGTWPGVETFINECYMEAGKPPPFIKLYEGEE